MNSCFEDLVSINGLCASGTDALLLDDIGISLRGASKIADGKFLNGAELVRRKINQAWKEAFKDLSIDGFNFKKIACEKRFVGDGKLMEVSAGSGQIVINKHKRRLTSIRLMDVSFSGSGEYTITITDEQTTFNLTSDDSVIDVDSSFYGDKITVNFSYTSANIRAVNGGCCGCGERCNFSIKGNSDLGLSFVVQEMCDAEAYFCAYSDMIAEAVLYKAGALILTELMNTDRINDFNIVNEKDLWVRIAYLDSSLNLFQYEDKTASQSGSKIIVQDGKYQLEINRLKKLLPIPKDRYCISCDSGFYSITLP